MQTDVMTMNRPQPMSRSTSGASRTDAPAAPTHDAGPLSPQHYEALATAGRRRLAIDRAVRAATFNGWTAAIFATLSAPFIFLNVAAIPISLGLGAIAFCEFRGRRLLQRLDERASLRLGLNQLALFGLIMLYCAWRIHHVLTAPSPYAQTVAEYPEIADMLEPIAGLHVLIGLALYGTVFLASAVFQGLMALYYFTRRKHIRAYREQTPDWIIKLQQALRY